MKDITRAKPHLKVIAAITCILATAASGGIAQAQAPSASSLVANVEVNGARVSEGDVIDVGGHINGDGCSFPEYAVSIGSVIQGAPVEVDTSTTPDCKLSIEAIRVGSADLQGNGLIGPAPQNHPWYCPPTWCHEAARGRLVLNAWDPWFGPYQASETYVTLYWDLPNIFRHTDGFCRANADFSWTNTRCQQSGGYTIYNDPYAHMNAEYTNVGFGNSYVVKITVNGYSDGLYACGYILEGSYPGSPTFACVDP